MRRAIYIGRFQVFHLGHRDVLEYITRVPDVDELRLVLGSCQYDHTRRSPVAPWEANPFTAAERRAMIERSTEGRLGKPMILHEIPDFHDWERWHAHIVSELPPFDLLYTADRDERDFFRSKGTEVRPFPRERSFHAGGIRDALARGAQDWREMVPEPVQQLLDALDAGTRLRELRARDQAEAGTPSAPGKPPPPPTARET